MDLITSTPADPSGGVDFYIAGLQYGAHRAVSKIRPPQNGSQATHYLAESKGDRNAIVGAGLKSAYFVLQLASRTNEDDPKVRREGAQMPASLESSVAVLAPADKY